MIFRLLRGLKHDVNTSLHSSCLRLLQCELGVSPKLVRQIKETCGAKAPIYL